MECSREAFLEHVARLLDGENGVPATYAYNRTVKNRVGQHTRQKLFETLSGHTLKGQRVVVSNSTGHRPRLIQLEQKATELDQLRTFFDQTLRVRYYLGAEYTR